MIPKLHYIVEGTSSSSYLENIQKACTAGIELVRLGFENIASDNRLELAKEARSITEHYQTRLIISNDYTITKDIKADGLYLDKSDLCPTTVRPQLYTWQTIGATATSLQEAETLLAKEIDYLCLGPFKESDTNKQPLGLNGYLLITEALATETPLIGYGGIHTTDVTDVLETGISGLAVSKSITNDFNAIHTFHKLLNASATEELRHTFK